MLYTKGAQDLCNDYGESSKSSGGRERLASSEDTQRESGFRRTRTQVRLSSSGPFLSSALRAKYSSVLLPITEFLLRNGYVDTSVQKGGVPRVPGCIEHTEVVTQLIREARENKGDLAVLWLDLANAYGSIPHKLVETSLDRRHVPIEIRDLILDYYSCFSLRVTSGTSTSAWHWLEKGIITGCTMLVILFALAMNMLVKAEEVERRGPLTKSGTWQPRIRVFMDNLTVTTTSCADGSFKAWSVSSTGPGWTSSQQSPGHW